jgi:transcriptional regulator with PAS, ATPase and Fis domain
MLSHSDFLGDLLSEEMTMRKYEQNIVRFYLRKYQNNIKMAAEKLDIGQATIYRMLKES